MQVIATAGHVDHGKSTLIRALTGIDPDRLAEEKQRGLTIDLGFAWAELPSRRGVSFVDVPGHERFLGNMLAGIGPAPIVCFVVAADDGWQAQSTDHRDAIAALGIDQGILVVTRADLAPERVEETAARMRREFAGTGLHDARVVAISALTGTGVEALRGQLDDLVGAARAPSPTQRVRLWVDRAFTIDGAGTVVTGTLAAGTVHVGDRFELIGHDPALGHRTREVVVRGLESRGGATDALGPVSRAAINLRAVATEEIARGDALVSPGAWWITDTIDVRRMTGAGLRQGPSQLVAHVGTAAIPARVRPFDEYHARLTLARALPLSVGDRIVLRGSAERSVHAGVEVLDVDPPALCRRGDGARRAETLTAMARGGDIRAEVARRGAVTERDLTRAGITIPQALPGGLQRQGELLVDQDALTRWSAKLREAVASHHQADALSSGLPRRAAADALNPLRPHRAPPGKRVAGSPNLPGLPGLPGLPDLPGLLDLVITAAGLREEDGRIRDPEQAATLGPAESAVAALEETLRSQPFGAPEAEELAELGLTAPQLAAAARQGRLLRLPGEVILLPSAPALAMRELARLPQPFTTSQARQALETTRRVAIPLLEHLDARGWTRRIDGGHREIVRGP